MLVGDFNEVILLSEVMGGAFSTSRAEKFSEILYSCRLLDLDVLGNRFTWEKRVQGNVWVSKRLD